MWYILAGLVVLYLLAGVVFMFLMARAGGEEVKFDWNFVKFVVLWPKLFIR